MENAVATNSAESSRAAGGASPGREVAEGETTGERRARHAVEMRRHGSAVGCIGEMREIEFHADLEHE